MFAAKTKKSAENFLLAGLMITVSIAWLATLGWILIVLLDALQS